MSEIFHQTATSNQQFPLKIKLQRILGLGAGEGEREEDDHNSGNDLKHSHTIDFCDGIRKRPCGRQWESLAQARWRGNCRDMEVVTGWRSESSPS